MRKDNREQEEGFKRAVEQGRVQGHEEAGECHWSFHPKGVGRVEQVKLVNWLTVETRRGSPVGSRPSPKQLNHYSV